MKLFRKTFSDGSYVEDQDFNLLPGGGELSEIDITERIKSIADCEVETLRIQTTKDISEFVSKWVQRKVIMGIDIPENIKEDYDRMKLEYHEKKQKIYTKYNINP